MGLCPIAVRDDACNLCLEQVDAFAQLVDRQVVKRFGGQLVGQIPFWAWAIVDIHYLQQCGAFVLAVNRVCG